MTEQSHRLPTRLRDRITLTVEEASEVTGISPAQIYRLVASEEWESVKIGRLTRIRTDWLERHLASQAHGGRTSQGNATD